MTYAKSRYLNGQSKQCSPSRFLKDINIKYLKVGLGSQIATPETRPSGRSYEQNRALYSNISQYSSRPRQASVYGSRPSQSAGINSDSEYTQHSAQELQTGFVIEHQRFGKGTIIEIDTTTPDQDKITVKFDNVNTKKLLLSFAKFKILR